MNEKEVTDMYLGLIIVGLGIYFHNWLGLIGLVPILYRVIDWLHGLYTYRSL